MMLFRKTTFCWSKCVQLTRQVLYREHIIPVFKHNLTKPKVDLAQHDPEGKFSPNVCEFIKARDFENSGGRKVEVISLQTGETQGSVEVNNFVFGANPRLDILHRNMVWYRASIRLGTASVKRRPEVRGGNKKPWPQKGGARARHGSRVTAMWRGGGSVKGPKPRDYSYALPFKIRRMGLRTALSCRYAQGDLVVVEDLDDLPPNSEEFQQLLKERQLDNALIVDAYENKELDELTNEIDRVTSTQALFLHVYGILLRHKLVLSLNALRILDEKLSEDGRIITEPRYELYHEDMMLDKELLFHEYDPKRKVVMGRYMKQKKSKSLRDKPPMSRLDGKRR